MNGINKAGKEIKKIEQTIGKNIKKIEQSTQDASKRAKKYRNSAFNRFPMVFVLLSSFGLVATFYGFEKVIDEIPLFVDHPRLILFTGILTLVITGSLYKKLT